MARSARYEITRTPFFESTDLPDAREVDFLIVMGGPMSVNDEIGIPGWLTKNVSFAIASRRGSPFWACVSALN